MNRFWTRRSMKYNWCSLVCLHVYLHTTIERLRNVCDHCYWAECCRKYKIALEDEEGPGSGKQVWGNTSRHCRKCACCKEGIFFFFFFLHCERLILSISGYHNHTHIKPMGAGWEGKGAETRSLRVFSQRLGMCWDCRYDIGVCQNKTSAHMKPDSEEYGTFESDSRI